MRFRETVDLRLLTRLKLAEAEALFLPPPTSNPVTHHRLDNCLGLGTRGLIMLESQRD